MNTNMIIHKTWEKVNKKNPQKCSLTKRTRIVYCIATRKRAQKRVKRNRKTEYREFRQEVNMRDRILRGSTGKERALCQTFSDDTEGNGSSCISGSGPL